MFISFEGTEGVGKSTLIKRVHDHFLEKNKEIILTREPGGTALAEKVRNLLLQVDETETMCADTELLLIYAARSQHLNQVILPALKEGKVVLSDRFTDASFAYQVKGRGLSQQKLELLNETFVPKMPDITFWLDAPIEVGMSRARARGELDRFEKEKLSFFSKVREGYAYLYEKHPKRIYKIDATCSEAEVFQQVLDILNAF
ncbi:MULTISPECIES: dTMP kinase [Acinetobacter]|jgi:dTMP kinase|uniref:Thymidylate kinase n=1 Tax=Acinetobacter pollinis TaxID=2605270 RepID=A0ABU6DQD6_9GAMM|nr:MULTISPECIES: dTMP kinase [Acinetobacter]MBF7689377.1 dTMP kinase [Acinetobacter pollinis]MBF7692024.1 dTMP kinase [Acinetobacter pollinis]MBF7697028.1 dTMP kinase [Acinetobacter pollinis]MBF7700419.1 dTMP kinase [Acinetobacter pollinis]MEB5476082.1 dTMP kinase [Acinetobacter pollinis]